MTIEQYKQVVQSRLSAKRWKHSLNVAEAAVKLAKKYGADVQKAEIAGILHDIMKETPPQEQLQIMQQFGIILSNIEKNAPKLWHAMSGAVYIQHELGVEDQDILEAVRYHTTGRADMSPLEKVIYIADYISAERDYDGVADMRKAANQSLEKAMADGMTFTIKDLAGRQVPIHPDTFAAYNQVVIFLKEK